MSRNTGTFSFAANFEVKTKQPLDARLVVDTKANLISPSIWEDLEANAWLFKGIIVSVVSDPCDNYNGAYFLKDDTQYTDPSSWVKIGSDIQQNNLNVDASLDMLREWNADQDASIVNLRVYIDGSLYTLKTWNTAIDASLAAIRIVDSNQDISIGNLSSLLSGKIDEVVSVAGVPLGYDVYAGEVNNKAYIKKIVAGGGVIINSDTSTITFSTGASNRYTGYFNGLLEAPFDIPAATHGLGTGPFIISVYEYGEQIQLGISCNAIGDITFNWTNSAITDPSCKFIIMG